MDFIENKDPILIRQRLIGALGHLSDLGITLRNNYANIPSYSDSVYMQVANVASAAARTFKTDLESNVPGGSPDISATAGAKFLELTYDVCSWIETGIPSQPIFDSILYDLVKKFSNSYSDIFNNRDSVSGRISGDMCGPFQDLDQIQPPSPLAPDDLDGISNEPITHRHNRLYARVLLSARQHTDELSTEVGELNIKVKAAHDANKKILAEVEKSRKVLDQVTKAKATAELTTHYETFATRNKWTYWIMFLLALASFLSAAWFGVGITLHWSGPIFPGENGLVQQDQIVAESIARIAIVAVLSGLGAFFAKQAGHYRKLYHWAESIGLQLKTFEAYVKDVSDDSQKNQLRTEFSRRVFGQEPGGDASPTNDGTLPASLLPLITEAVRSLAKSPDKG